MDQIDQMDSIFYHSNRMYRIVKWRGVMLCVMILCGASRMDQIDQTDQMNMTLSCRMVNGVTLCLCIM